jgi:hypothetical protein
MKDIHTKTCGQCSHWFRLGKENVGECFAHPPRVFRVVKVNPLDPRQQTDGLVSHYPVTNVQGRSCGEFVHNLESVN